MIISYLHVLQDYIQCKSTFNCKDSWATNVFNTGYIPERVDETMSIKDQIHLFFYQYAITVYNSLLN